MKFIDLFSGAGGFSRGFREVGFKPVLAIDIDADAEKSYKGNYPEAIFLRRDISTIHSSMIIEVVGEPDIVIASPPCESFTRISRDIMEDPLDRLYTDPRGRLTLKAIELIGDLSPEVFIIENVPGILNKPLPRYIAREFRRVGYKKIYFNLLRAEGYGSPSVRRRVFISNIKLEPEPSDIIKTVWDAINDLPDPRYPNDIDNHTYVSLPARFREKVSRLKWGQALDYYLGGDKKEYKQFMRLHPNKRCPTIMGKSRFIHPYDDRLLTIREQARLMGYPDKHVFRGGIENMYNQVGESVPPPLSRAIAEYIKS